MMVTNGAAFSVRYALQCVSESLCVWLYNMEKIKKLSCTPRTQSTSTDHSPTLRIDVLEHAHSVCTNSINTPFPHNLYVKNRETSFSCFAKLKTNIEKRYRLLMNIFRVVILGDHLRYHHWFLTTTIFVGMIVFFLLGMGLLKNCCRERV